MHFFLALLHGYWFAKEISLSVNTASVCEPYKQASKAKLSDGN